MRKVNMLGFPVEVSEPYGEGHKCNAAEADVLNQTRSQNIGNNLRDDIRKLAEVPEKESKASAAMIEQHQTAVQALVTDYDLGKEDENGERKDGYTLSGGGRRTVRSPLERIQWRMAGESLQAWLSESGRKRSEFSDDDWNAERERLAQDPAIVEAAQEELAKAEARKAPKVGLK